MKEVDGSLGLGRIDKYTSRNGKVSPTFFYFWYFSVEAMRFFDLAIGFWLLARWVMTKGASFRTMAPCLVLACLSMGWLWNEMKHFPTEHLILCAIPPVILVLLFITRQAKRFSKFELGILASLALVAILLECIARTDDIKYFEAQMNAPQEEVELQQIQFSSDKLFPR